MPTYEYACRDCGRNLEVVQSFTDDPLETCENCGGRLRKVFSAAGIIFKGSGYYVTDTRTEKGRAAAASSAPGSSDGESSGSETSSGSKDTSANGTSSSTSDTAGSSPTTGSSSSDAKSA